MRWERDWEREGEGETYGKRANRIRVWDANSKQQHAIIIIHIQNTSLHFTYVEKYIRATRQIAATTSQLTYSH